VADAAADARSAEFTFGFLIEISRKTCIDAFIHRLLQNLLRGGVGYHLIDHQSVFCHNNSCILPYGLKNFI
jgi:hypothetical protein